MGTVAGLFVRRAAKAKVNIVSCESCQFQVGRSDMRTMYLVNLLAVLATATASEMYEMETDKPQHIPILEPVTEEPLPIPVPIPVSEWPVQTPDQEDLQQLKNWDQDMIDDRITNGQKVPITSRPYQVHLGNCGGSLIHPNWVLTAGHCVTDNNGQLSGNAVSVRAGSEDKTLGETRLVPYCKVKVHPKWKGNINSKGIVDLALLYIDTPFTTSSKIQTIPMNTAYSNLKGKTATLSGWGKTQTEDYPQFLTQISPKITMDANDHNGMGILRMPNTAGSGVCQGDSGGPATIQTSGGTDILVGVASYVMQKCGKGVNGAMGTYTYDSANYVDIYNYMDWIKQTMNEGNRKKRSLDSLRADTCTDTSNGATDNWNDGCPEYAKNKSWCGKYNNAVFQSDKMCCACGGGKTEATGSTCSDANSWCASNASKSWFLQWCTLKQTNANFGGTTLMKACQKSCNGCACEF